MADFKVNYYRKPDGLIMVRSKFNTPKSLTRSTGIILTEKEWQAHNGKKRNPELSAIEGKLLAAYNELKILEGNSFLTLEEIHERAYPSRIIVKKVTPKSINIPEGLRAYAQKYSNPKSQDYKPSARDGYTVAIHWCLFEQKQGETFNWAELNNTVLHAYQRYLETDNDQLLFLNNKTHKHCKKRALSGGTIAHHFSVMKRAAKELIDSKVEVSQSLLNFKYQNTAKGKSKINLSWEEVQALRKFEPANDRERVILDVFLFCCYTGCRPSEAFKIENSHIDREFINYYASKTNKHIQASLHRYNFEIIARYDESEKYLFPRKVVFPYSDRVLLQKPNKLIKEIAKKAEIERYNQISLHVGRHTANNLLRKLGVDGFVRREEIGHAHGSINDSNYTSIEPEKRRAIIVEAWERAEEHFARLKELNVHVPTFER